MLTNSISAAARSLNRSQPAVSLTIKELEAQLATNLFDRKAGRLIPRVEAMVLYERVKPIIEQMRSIEENFSKVENFSKPTVSVIGADNVGIHLLPFCLQRVARDIPLKARIMNGAAAHVITAMENQKYDFGVADLGIETEPPESVLYSCEIFDFHIYAVCRKGVLQCDKETISTEELTTANICTLYSEHALSKASQFHNISNAVQAEFQNFFPMTIFALQNDYVAIVDRITCETLKRIFNGNLDADCKKITTKYLSRYYLLRPSYRLRSEAADRCYDSVRQELVRLSA